MAIFEAGTDRVPSAERPPSFVDDICEDGDAGVPLHILSCGSVDDGKSTLIGRLLWDGTRLAQDRRAHVMSLKRSQSAYGSEYNYSALTDGLREEQAQGITIDIAWLYADIGPRRLVIIDAPGHVQYTSNMFTGATQAQGALILVDATQGPLEQTRRHMAVCAFAGIRQAVVCVNKMDQIAWQEKPFRKIELEVRRLAADVGLDSLAVIPTSALMGENVVHRSGRMPWYEGPAILPYVLREFSECQRNEELSPFRFPVQRVTKGPDGRRYLEGTVASGSIAIGDTVSEPVSGLDSVVAAIGSGGRFRDSAVTGEAISIVLSDAMDVGRGSVLCDPEQPASVAVNLDAKVFWLTRPDVIAHGNLLFCTTTDRVPLSNVVLADRAGSETGTRGGAERFAFSDAALTLSRPTSVDPEGGLPVTGRFILVSAIDGRTVAGGIIRRVKKDQGSGKRFFLRREVLAKAVCEDLGDAPFDNREFHIRARGVASILESAGVAVELEGA